MDAQLICNEEPSVVFLIIYIATVQDIYQNDGSETPPYSCPPPRNTPVYVPKAGY